MTPGSPILRLLLVYLPNDGASHWPKLCGLTPDDVNIYPENRMSSLHLSGLMTGTVIEKDKSCHFFSVSLRFRS
jgi:hypothetical protein